MLSGRHNVQYWLTQQHCWRAQENAENLKLLTEGVHSREALDVVKDHVKNVMGPASIAYSNTILKMSKLQAAQVGGRTQAAVAPCDTQLCVMPDVHCRKQGPASMRGSGIMGSTWRKSVLIPCKD